jgi:integrase
MKSLTKVELDALLAATPEPDRLMLKVAVNHGLRVSELVSLDASNIIGNHLVVQRLKKSRRTTQPLLPNEKDGLLALAQKSGKFFPMSRYTVDRRIKEYGKKAGLPAFKCHAHALRHTTGRLGYLAGIGIPEIQKYLGHVSGSNTLIYLESSEEDACNAYAAVVGK